MIIGVDDADMINKFKNGEIVKNMDDTIRRQTEMNRKLDSPNAEDNKEGHTGIKGFAYEN
jgi:hypothetical protein